MKKILTILLLFFVLNAVSAIRISPASIRIDFEPNFEESYTFRTNAAENTGVYIEGDLTEYITVEKNNIDKDGSFVIKIKLPAEIEKAGDNVAFIGVVEGAKDGGMVAGRASIRAPVVIRVPYPGIYAEIGFNVRDLNINETANFVVTINNLGKVDIDNAKAVIDILDINDEIVEKLFTDEKKVKIKNSGRLEAFFNASKHKTGKYKAIAHVTYADRSKDLEKIFKIGTLNVKIINYTRTFLKDKVAKFDIETESGWNSKVDNIFAEVKIFNNTKEVSSFKTVSFSLEPWEKKIISTFWDPQRLGEGAYDIEIILFYEGQTNKFTGKIYITSLEERASFFKKYLNITNFLIVIVISLIIINAVVLLRKRKK